MTDPARRATRVELRLPPHIGVFLGASTAAYAVTLAGVTALQAQSEAALVADRAPVVAGVDAIAARNAQLAAALSAAGADYQAATDAYVADGGRLADLEQALAALATKVATIDGVSRSLPTSVNLPKVVRRVTTSTAPATSSTTGASGVP
ncbi:MAG: hypothetical protein HY263_11195 [Chloroflexi bacterium]|nr:hypothetical protein [Chloroflexota bacterium]